MTSRTTQIAGLVLAGGGSRRMGGGHKFLLELGGRTMLEHALARLAPQVAALAISANCDPALLGQAELPVLKDPPPGSRGPLSGIRAGIAWAASQGFGRLLTAASDTPFFPQDLATRLAEAAPTPGTVVVAASGGRLHPVFALWPATLGPAIDRFLEEGSGNGAMAFIERCDWTAVDFAIEDARDPFFNVNTRDDLAEARRRADQGA